MASYSWCERRRTGLKLFRQVFEVEVLSEGEPLASDIALGRIEYEITECVVLRLVAREVICEEVTPERMRGLLIAQGSDPDFGSTGGGNEDCGQV